jgi:exonuclease VII small subunit
MPIIAGKEGVSPLCDIFDIPGPPSTQDVDEAIEQLNEKLGKYDLYLRKAPRLKELFELGAQECRAKLEQAQAERARIVNDFREQLRARNFDPDNLSILAFSCSESIKELEAPKKELFRRMNPSGQESEDKAGIEEVISGLRDAERRFRQCMTFLQQA